VGFAAIAARTVDFSVEYADALYPPEAEQLKNFRSVPAVDVEQVVPDE
jgi:hypothetical protein